MTFYFTICDQPLCHGDFFCLKILFEGNTPKNRNLFMGMISYTDAASAHFTKNAFSEIFSSMLLKPQTKIRALVKKQKKKITFSISSNAIDYCHFYRRSLDI